MNTILIYKFIRLAGFLIIICGLADLTIHYFGIFKNKSLSSIYEKLATGYGLISLGLVIEAIEMWFEQYQIKWVKVFFIFLGQNQYLNYLIVAGIFILLAIYQYLKSLRMKINEQ